MHGRRGAQCGYLSFHFQLQFDRGGGEENVEAIIRNVEYMIIILFAISLDLVGHEM